ncbi:hypothetical protein ACFLWA_09040 [Chloroflexota bacterium]
MKAIIASNTQNRTQWLIAVLAVVLLVALMIPGLAWADHSSDHPESQFDLAGEEPAYVAAATYSGDDDYDPAAGGEPEQSVAAVSQGSVSETATSFSGDDDYDPAAGGEPEQSVAGIAQESASVISVGGEND